MLFLLKQLLLHVLLYTLLALFIQIALAACHLPFEEAISIASLLNLSWQTAHEFIAHLLTRNFEAIKLLQWTFWIFSSKIYYVLALLVVLIFYYNLSNKNLKQPSIVLAPKLKSDDFERLKQEKTRQEVQKLQQSPQYEIYKRNKLLGRLREVPQNDEVMTELRQKQQQLFQNA